MPVNPRTLGTVAKWAIQYGPYVKKAAEEGGPAVREAAERRLAQAQGRRRALLHASTLVDGTVLLVVDPQTRRQVWVVFSGAKPVSTHPPTDTPLETLVADADLSKRRSPADVPGLADRLRPGRRRAKG